MSKWTDFLNKLNITDSDLQESNLIQVFTNKYLKKVTLDVELNKIIDGKLMINFDKTIHRFFYYQGLDCLIRYTYLNKEFSDELIESYFLPAIEELSTENMMITTLSKYNHETTDGVMRFKCATAIEQTSVNDQLVSLVNFYRKFNLELNANCIVSTMELSVIEKYNLKKDLEKQKYDAMMEEKYRLNQYQASQDRYDYRDSKVNVIPYAEIQDLPITEMEVIEYKQTKGTSKVSLKGVIIKKDLQVRPNKKGGENFLIFIADVTNYVDTITVKKFYRKPDAKFYEEELQEGMMIKVDGSVQYDNFSQDVVVMMDHITVLGQDTLNVRFDEAENKRVELHAHSKMSVLDSVLNVDEYVALAKTFNHKALALTDHHNIQAMPSFFKACKGANIKPICGIESNLIDENRYKITLTEGNIDLNNQTFVVFDIETTGLRNNYDDIIEIGAVKVVNGIQTDTYSTFVKPTKKISSVIENITNISNDDVIDAPTISEVLPKFDEFIQGSILVGHNVTFDYDFMKQKYRECKMKEFNYPAIDTMQLARSLYGEELKIYGLEKVAKFLKVAMEPHHRALNDAITTNNIFSVMLGDLKDRGIINYNQINSIITDDAFKFIHPRHFTMLVKNKVGLKNLYIMLSDALTDHFYKEARFLKSIVSKYREGILIGSSCVDGEIFRLAYEKSYDDLVKAIDFYDYIEIQPLENYRFLIDTSGEAVTAEYIKDAINKIIKAAKEKNKILVATGDVHHLNKDDYVLRDILINVDRPDGIFMELRRPEVKKIPTQPFYTTTEMLENFSYLGEELAYEMVVTNTNKIADMIEEFDLFKKGDNALSVPRDDFLKKYGINSMAQSLRDESYAEAKRRFGEDLHPYIIDRLERELKNIIGNGYSSVYYISKMLVERSNKEGYIVGSRGSVGSSFVASMMKITEVNPLKPYYHCPHCHFIAFKLNKDEEIKYNQNKVNYDILNALYSVDVGFDLPDKLCPHCKTPLEKDGCDIAFETFLGFNGDKVPDIDLNFSNEYQNKAHLFCREMFGENNAFRVGTISTVAEKTGFGYAKGYIERTGHNLRKAEINRIASKLIDVKRTTGQHPGGIVVVPDYMDYTEVFPVQYPSDDIGKTWRTTHYDYHKFEDNLLKLDILGHDDPTMIKTLMDYVYKYQEDFDFNTVDGIPYLDKECLKLFSSKEPLHLMDKDDDNLSSGTIGIPEFGTDFARGMLEIIQIKTFSEIIKTSGLAHGTNVWEGNQKNLIIGDSPKYNGKLTMSDIICCRDDIMVYLYEKKGLPPFDAFSIMEKVRKGYGLSEAHEALMKKFEVPNWYIETCKSIRYLFPKAHATAYVIMGLRIAWFKIYKPIYYYAAYFSKRCDEFDVEVFTGGKNAVKNKMREIANKPVKTNKEIALYEELKIVLEMYLRGFRFRPIDINISGSTDFVIAEDKRSLYMSIASVEKLGKTIADSVVESREEYPFTSIEDCKRRTKLNKTQFATLKALGAFGDLPENDINQLVKE